MWVQQQLKRTCLFKKYLSVSKCGKVNWLTGGKWNRKQVTCSPPSRGELCHCWLLHFCLLMWLLPSSFHQPKCFWSSKKSNGGVLLPCGCRPCTKCVWTSNIGLSLCLKCKTVSCIYAVTVGTFWWGFVSVLFVSWSHVMSVMEMWLLRRYLQTNCYWDSWGAKVSCFLRIISSILIPLSTYQS